MILPFLGWRSSAVDCDGNKVQQGVAMNLLDSFARLFEVRLSLLRMRYCSRRYCERFMCGSRRLEASQRAVIGIAKYLLIA
jgi:hypothetical protein